jgi:hypothetical protein
MAADDIMYSEQDGKVIPTAYGVPKIFVTGNVLIGSAGLISCGTPIEYKLQDWIADLIQAQHSAPDKRPRAIAETVYGKMRETFEPIEPSVEQEIWKGHIPGDRLVSYLVAGYTKDFTKPYIYEVGIEINAEGSGFVYLPPQHRSDDSVWLGEDKYFLRAIEGEEPQGSLRQNVFSEIVRDAAHTFPDLPAALQDAVASVVSLIKIESQFNPEKVGRGVNVAVSDRSSRQTRMASF